MADKVVLDVIYSLGQQEDVPQAIIDAVVQRLRPSIRLVPQLSQAESTVGGCRIGGAPDLPEGLSWPRLSDAWDEDPAQLQAIGFVDTPLPFLMQINLEEVAPFDVGNELPRTGMLYFFFLQGDSEEDDQAYILHGQGPASHRMAFPDGLADEQRYQGFALPPYLEWTAPSPEDTGGEEGVVGQHLGLWDDLESTLAQAQGLESPRGVAPAHRLLGHPQLIQSPGLADGTRLLLQIDSDPPIVRGDQWPRTGMTWGDGGRVFYLIGEERLKVHKFEEKPWAFMETH